MAKAKLRNRELHRLLVAAFGRAGVRVVRPGEAGDFGKGKILYNGERRYRLEKKSNDVGEEFAVSCPFCGDRRRRLYVNHRWGTRDPYSGRRVLWLCHCYNEECQSDFRNRIRLAEKIFGDDKDTVTVDETVSVVKEKKQLSLPGDTVSLGSLITTSGRLHPAIEWCYGRGYDVRELHEVYGVGYCAEGRYQGDKIEGRLVVPWYKRGGEGIELSGWTARRLNDDLSEEEKEDAGGKWMHAPAPTGGVVYGLGLAKQFQTVVPVEGPGDVFGVGPQGAAVLGKTLNARKAELIGKAVSRELGQVIVIALDPNLSADAKRSGKEHHIEEAIKVMRRYTKCPVAGIYLPQDSDPGSLHRDYLWDYLIREAKKQGVSATRNQLE